VETFKILCVRACIVALSYDSILPLSPNIAVRHCSRSDSYRFINVSFYLERAYLNEPEGGNTYRFSSCRKEREFYHEEERREERDTGGGHAYEEICVGAQDAKLLIFFFILATIIS